MGQGLGDWFVGALVKKIGDSSRGTQFWSDRWIGHQPLTLHFLLNSRVENERKMHKLD